jgi:hypothetical protein
MGKEQLLGSAQSKHTKAVPAFRASKASFPLPAFRITWRDYGDVIIFNQQTIAGRAAR